MYVNVASFFLLENEANMGHKILSVDDLAVGT